MVELDEEISKVEQGLPEGEDGVVGECMDNIACHLDMIFQHKPDITDEELEAVMEAKCAKWADRYRDQPSTQQAGA